jgi:hypothetical protein
MVPGPAFGAAWAWAGLVGMWLRHVNPAVIVDSRIMLTKAGHR